jgi:glutaredoxin 2
VTYTRILTDLERRQAKAYLKQDGERTLNIQVLVARARKYLPQIRADLDTLERLLETYERSKAKG